MSDVRFRQPLMVMGLMQLALGLIITASGVFVYVNCHHYLHVNLALYIGPILVLFAIVPLLAAHFEGALAGLLGLFAFFSILIAFAGLVNGIIGVQCEFQGKYPREGTVDACNAWMNYVAASCKTDEAEIGSQLRDPAAYQYVSTDIVNPG
ncbi:unnamed protein product [Soboliphyme baturini]|uniref:MARVEL domain-containing protein n=1 Tax=Soboliphyme baturini TaxID=241478 RepID=A0A183IE35_9BILA|nr:unnamed protein product [Soboliphyme baturini]